jgi:hypothetical protein
MSTARMKVHFPQIENLKKQIYKQEIKKRPDSPRPPIFSPKIPAKKLVHYSAIQEDQKKVCKQ